MEKNRTPATRFLRYPFVHRQYVAWGEMDPFAHLNNVVYARYFENARVEFFERLGVWSHEARSEHGPVIINLEMQFRRQVRYPATLDVTLGITRLKSRSMSFLCSMWQGDECVHTAKADSLWVHFEQESPRSIPSDLIGLLHEYVVDRE